VSGHGSADTKRQISSTGHSPIVFGTAPVAEALVGERGGQGAGKGDGTRFVFFLSSATWRGVHWRVIDTNSSSPFLSLPAVLRAMRAAVGGWGGLKLLEPVLALLLYRRLGRVCRDIEGLMARFQAGTLVRRACRADAAAGAPVERTPRGRAVWAWPGRFGWLVRLASYHAAGYGSQLRAVLGQPEMIALLRAAPQAGRILRPVCRMLAVETSLLRPWPEGAAPEAVPAEVAPEVKARVRRPRVPIDWGRIPLPRGVLAAARRQGFGKIR
jgi:hypothetical protein